jgi:hypothetical protein
VIPLHGAHPEVRRGRTRYRDAIPIVGIVIVVVLITAVILVAAGPAAAVVAPALSAATALSLGFCQLADRRHARLGTTRS